MDQREAIVAKAARAPTLHYAGFLVRRALGQPAASVFRSFFDGDEHALWVKLPDRYRRRILRDYLDIELMFGGRLPACPNQGNAQ